MMQKRSLSFLSYMDQLRWAFGGNSVDELEKLLKDIPKAYEKDELCVDHYVALMNCANGYLRIMEEERRNGS